MAHFFQFLNGRNAPRRLNTKKVLVNQQKIKFQDLGMISKTSTSF